MAAARKETRSRTRGRRSGRRGQPDRQRQESHGLPYVRRNAQVFAAGIGVILIGYLCLAQPPVDGFLSLTLAPILLVLGYCVLIPIALLIGGPSGEEETSEEAEDTVGG
jgi:hypothetical protein